MPTRLQKINSNHTDIASEAVVLTPSTNGKPRRRQPCCTTSLVNYLKVPHLNESDGTVHCQPRHCQTQPKRLKGESSNAGVLLVGASSRHDSVACVLLGGRFYTKRQAYVYTDFGGGVEPGETAKFGACREFAEELLGQSEDEARSTASKLCRSCSSLDDKSFIHKGLYEMFIFAAETVVETLDMSPVTSDTSAIDRLFESAKQNSELTSVALISIEELLRGAFTDGCINPLQVTQLDGQERHSAQIRLRQVMIGSSGSIATVRDALERYMDQVENSRTLIENVYSKPQTLEDQKAEPSSSSGHQGSKQRRWNRSNQDVSQTMLEMMPKRETSTPCSMSVGISLSSLEQATPYVFDMETGDPDDVLTLLFLAANPRVDLRAVTITPGSEEQVALVRWLLRHLGLTHVRLGAQDWPNNRGKVVNLNTEFYKSFGRMPRGEPQCERAQNVLVECCDDSTTLLTGGPLHNLDKALEIGSFRVGRWIAQGGFAGEGVVPESMQLDKFRGMKTCATWNFGGNREAAQQALQSPAIACKVCVSKNVCHGVCYDDEFHDALAAAATREAESSPKNRAAVAFALMHAVMGSYLRKKPDGKKLHDPLALAVAIDESVCDLAEVELFCEGGKWGSRMKPGSGVRISIAYDKKRFMRALMHFNTSWT